MSQVPTLEEVRAEPDQVRKAILEAILRVVEERPLHIEVGDYSVVGLADEAGVKRHWFNQRHKDLRERYQFIRDHFLDPPPPVDEDARIEELLRRISVLEARLAEAAVERDHWKTSAELFVRAMNVQEVDLATRDTTIARLKRRLEAASNSSGVDEVGERRHRRSEL